jgi:4'-phosphopantetheinyl transferase
MGAAWSSLDAAEQRRAWSFRRPEDAHRFVLAHATLRSMVAHLVGCRPVEISVQADAHGRPWVLTPDGGRWRASLSHAGTIAIAAVADGIDVGVDVEPVDRRRSDPAVADRYLRPAGLPGRMDPSSPAWPSAFATAWTGLEAEAKGRGASLDALAGRPRTGVLQPLDVGAGHVATVWTPGPALVDRALLASLA